MENRTFMQWLPSSHESHETADRVKALEKSLKAQYLYLDMGWKNQYKLKKSHYYFPAKTSPHFKLTSSVRPKILLKNSILYCSCQLYQSTVNIYLLLSSIDLKYHNLGSKITEIFFYYYFYWSFTTCSLAQRHYFKEL